MKNGESTPLLGSSAGSSGDQTMSAAACFAAALDVKNGGAHDELLKLPQAIGHRGYKAAFPENTMAAFRGCVDVGAHAIETDIHLSKDGVVVLTHDPSLKRCYGEDAMVAGCDWEHLSTLRTVQEPHEAMPRLVDLLEYLAKPEQQHIWVLIDIKTTDDAEKLLGATAAAIASVPTTRPWKERIVMGGWTPKHIKVSLDLLPGFPAALIGVSLLHANALMAVPNLNFNIYIQSLFGPFGAYFLRSARRHSRLVFGWTVNDEDWMDFSIRKGLDGVISDDPKKYLEVCERRRRGVGAERPRGVVAAARKMAGDVVEWARFFFFSSNLTIRAMWRDGLPGKVVRETFQKR